MIHIGICDDNAAARMQLRSALERNLYARGSEYDIFEFSSGEGMLGWFEKHHTELDLLFLDIEMGSMDGMEAARRIRVRNAAVQLVFVTGYADYVVDGYEVGALDYLMKPAQPDRLNRVLTRAFAALHLVSDAVFLCRNTEGTYRIPRCEILYFFSDRRLITCVTASRSYPFYGKLDEVQEELDGSGFVRIHQRYLVRAGAVSRIGDGEVSVGKENLPISRSYRKDAMLALTRAMLEDGI